jgi:ankyrin repeat protein
MSYTEFITLINTGNEDGAIQMIPKLSESDLSKIDETTITTPLIMAIVSEMSNLALELIKTGHSKPEYITPKGNTALILSCVHIMNEVALALIQTGQSKPEQVSNDDETALILACVNDMNEVALALIQTGQSKPDHVDRWGDTSLILVCKIKMNEVALALIQTGQSKPDHVSNDNETALIIACNNEMNEVALALIKTKQSKPEHIVNDSYNELNTRTALMISCIKDMNEVALALIQTGQSKPDHVSNNGETSLMFACENQMSEVALTLIQTGQSRPEQVSNYGLTSLILACSNRMNEVALALIQTGQSKPEQVTELGNTALITTCLKKMTDVSLTLIKTGNSNPSVVDNNGDTALILACSNKMQDTAIAIIQTGESNPRQKNNRGKTALMIAQMNKMSEVVKLLKEIENPINLNASIYSSGYDFVLQQNFKVSEYINSDINNICFNVHNKNYLVNKTSLKTIIKDKGNTKYGCIRAGNGSVFVTDKNINYKPEYLSCTPLFGLQILVTMNEIKEIVHNKMTSKLFFVIDTHEVLQSIISRQFIDGGGGLGADHCQTGKRTKVYRIIPGVFSCDPVSEEREEPSKKIQPENTINIQYKGEIIQVPVTPESTIESIKNFLIEYLMTNNKIQNANQSVRFIYRGKVYNDSSNGSMLINQLPDFSPGITLHGMTLQQSNEDQKGGKTRTKTIKTKKKYLRKKRNTRKRKYRILVHKK